MRAWSIVVAALAGAGLARRLGAVHHHLQRADPDLRTLSAHLTAFMSPRTMDVTRRLASLRRPHPVPGVAVRDERAEADGRGVDLIVMEPAGRDRPSPALLWLHGGGYTMQRAADSIPDVSRFARALGLLVVSVEYRLAPEHPFPAAHEDAMAGLLWLHTHADELGIDPSRIAVGGDSAGGGLAAGVAQRAHDEGMAVAFQLLRYPMIDDRTCATDPPAGVGELVWTPLLNRYGWTSYLGHEPAAPTVAPYAAPGRRTDLTGLPPAWIGVGELDLFRAEDEAYADALRAAGVPVTLDVVPGFFHGADQLAPGAPLAQRFGDLQIAALRRGLELDASGWDAAH